MLNRPTSASSDSYEGSPNAAPSCTKRSRPTGSRPAGIDEKPLPEFSPGRSIPPTPSSERSLDRLTNRPPRSSNRPTAANRPPSFRQPRLNEPPGPIAITQPDTSEPLTPETATSETATSETVVSD